MDLDEWCAVAHVDIGTRAGLDEIEAQLTHLVTSPKTVGTIELSALRLTARPNHFELVGRYRGEAPYVDYLATSSNESLRGSIAPVLGSPYEDRIHGPKGPQSWPQAATGDCVVITQIEAFPVQAEAASSLVDAVAAAQRADDQFVGQVVLRRRARPNNFEILSVWSSPESFDEHTTTEAGRLARGTLSSLLVAPIDDRRCQLFAGAWSIP